MKLSRDGQITGIRFDDRESFREKAASHALCSKTITCQDGLNIRISCVKPGKP